MSLTDTVTILRAGGEVITGVSQQPFASVVDAARHFGLRPRGDAFASVTQEEAFAVLRLVLHHDLAHGHEVMPEERASSLADQFLNQFPTQGTSYYTNGEFGRKTPGSADGPSWVPVTDATFDTGVLVLSQHSAGCLWVMDED